MTQTNHFQPVLVLSTAVLLNHSDGFTEYTSPAREMLPVLYVWVFPRLVYYLVFAVAEGPVHPGRNVSDVVIATESDHDLVFNINNNCDSPANFMSKEKRISVILTLNLSLNLHKKKTVSGNLTFNEEKIATLKLP